MTVIFAALLSTGCSEFLTEPAERADNYVRLSAASSAAVSEIQVINQSSRDFVAVLAAPCAGGDTVSLGAARARIGATLPTVVASGCSDVIVRYDLADPTFGFRARVEVPAGQRATLRYIDLRIRLQRP